MRSLVFQVLVHTAGRRLLTRISATVEQSVMSRLTFSVNMRVSTTPVARALTGVQLLRSINSAGSMDLGLRPLREILELLPALRTMTSPGTVQVRYVCRGVAKYEL